MSNASERCVEDRHVFCFNPGDNGGESLILVTEFVARDGSRYVEQELTLQSYCNSASFNLHTAQLSPDALRQLTSELEERFEKFYGARTSKRPKET